MKKLLALLLAFTLMASVTCGIPVLAADNTSEAVTVLKALGILIGDESGNLNLDKPITRAEFSTILLRVLEVDDTYGAEVDFIDVPKTHWGYNAIANCYNLKIINGYGDGTFKPDNSVSYEEAVKMVMCVLGYEPLAQAKGGYPTGYLIAANQAKVTNGVGTKATRLDIAQLVFNALSAPLMEQTSFGSDSEFTILNGKGNTEYKTLLTEKDIYVASGIVGEKDIAKDTIAFDVKENSNDLEFTAGIDEIFDINKSNIADYQNEYVDVYVKEYQRNKYETIIAVPSNMGDTITINANDIKEFANNKLEYYVDGSKTKTIKLNEDITVIKYPSDFEDYEDVELKFINHGESVYDIVIATKYAAGRIYKVDKDRLKIDNKWVDIDYDKDVDYIFVDAKDNELDSKDFEEDDVVAIVSDNSDYNSAKYLKIIKLTDNAVTGTVTETSKQNGKKYVWIDNDKYEDTYGLKIEDEGTFYISMTGKIFDFEGISAAGNYAYILEAAKNSSAAFSKDTWEIKVLTMHGVTEFTLTEEASVTYEDILSDIGLYEDNKDNYENRVITYKTNSKGLIRTIDFVDFDLTDMDEYNSRTQKLDGNIIEDDTVIFDVTAAKANSTFATDIDYLVDEGEYQGLVVKNDNKEVELLVIVNSKAKLSDEIGLAIVTEIKTKFADGEELIVVDYIQDMDKDTIIFTEDSEPIVPNGITLDKLNIGSVFMFNAENNYLIVGVINKDGYLEVDINALNEFSEDNEFVYGYIANEDGGKNKKYETIEVGGVNVKDLSVGVDTNTYCYFDGHRTTEIKTSYIVEDADWYKVGTADDGSEDEATVFFARLLDDSVIDIYTFNTRIIGKDNIDDFEGFHN